MGVRDYLVLSLPKFLNDFVSYFDVTIQGGKKFLKKPLRWVTRPQKDFAKVPSIKQEGVPWRTNNSFAAV